MMMSRPSDDLSLVEACRAGRTEAFSLLVQRYQGRLYPTIARLIGSAEDAEDILQDAFVRAFEKLDQFQGDSSFYTWIYRIAVNLALSGHRRRRVRSVLRLGDRRPAARGHHPADESVESDPAAPLERAERERIVKAALDHLGPEHRAVVILKDFDGPPLRGDQRHPRHPRGHGPQSAAPGPLRAPRPLAGPGGRAAAGAARGLVRPLAGRPGPPDPAASRQA